MSTTPRWHGIPPRDAANMRWEKARREKAQKPPMAPPDDIRRRNHRYDEQTIGPVSEAIFQQPLTGVWRTVEIIRYTGHPTWKARIVETQSLLVRLGMQCEFTNAAAARAEVTRYFCDRLKMRLVREWKETNSHPAPPASKSGMAGVMIQ